MADLLDFASHNAKTAEAALFRNVQIIIALTEILIERAPQTALKDVMDWSGATRVFLGENHQIIIDGEPISRERFIEFAAWRAHKVANEIEGAKKLKADIAG